MSSSNEIDIEALEWLNIRRAKIQEFLLEVLAYGKAKEPGKNFTEPEISVFTYLVGVGFSLWRAIFLGTRRRPQDEVVEHAKYVLKQLVVHNAFAYPQEQNSRAWMWGFHVNSAAFRVAQMKKDCFGGDALTDAPALSKYELRPVPDDDVNRWEVWDEIYDAANDALKLLKAGGARTAA
jgi:homogentisate 1,2-dioxygenase